jgi:hypothetical protein
LLGIGQVTIEDRYAMRDAIDHFGVGMDFADSVHLTRSQRAAAFVTFDRRLARRAADLGCATSVERLG